MKRIKKSQRLACRIISGQAFIVNSQTSTLYELNDTGSFLWKTIDSISNPEKLVESLAENYEVSVTTAKKDVQIFLDQLKKDGLIKDI